jgi:hypothetical protein
MITEKNQHKRRLLDARTNKIRKHIKRSSAGTRSIVSQDTVDHAEISGSAGQLMEKVRFDVMSIIDSCESPDNENAYDIGYRDG